MELEKFKQNIEKTGFVLEYKISSILQNHNWNTINNKYYIDDVTKSVREIDIFAYKVKRVDFINFYTVLLISAKKSDQNNWAFLTKDLNQNDPNFDYIPISTWTNYKYLKYMLNESDWKERILKQKNNSELIRDIYNLDRHLFAFQEMNKTSGKVQNDKKIFNSMSSLTKALSYEITNLNKKESSPAFYNFQLVTIVDTNLIELNFQEEKINCKEIDEIKYINRFIVNSEEYFFRIDFLKFEKFERKLEYYNQLHDWNCNFYFNLAEEFQNNAISDNRKREFILNEYPGFMRSHIESTLDKYCKHIPYLGRIDMSYHNEMLEISVDTQDVYIGVLNSSIELLNMIGNFLEYELGYSGKFKFIKFEYPF